MSYNNIVADTFSRIRNACLLKQLTVNVRRSVFILQVLDFLYQEGYIRGYSIVNIKEVTVHLKYIKNACVIKELKQISTPGRRVYLTIRDINNYLVNKKYLGNYYVISTSNGLKTLTQCVSENIGGLLLFKVN